MPRRSEQPPKSVGQQPLDASAKPARQHRNRATGRNADDDRIAIDDRGHDEARQIGAIDDVGEHTLRPCRPRHARIDVATAGRGVDYRAPFDIDGREGPRPPPEIAGLGGQSDLAVDDGRHDRHGRPSAAQQPDLGHGRTTAANDQRAVRLHVEEYGQISHVSLTDVVALLVELRGAPAFRKGKLAKN